MTAKLLEDRRSFALFVSSLTLLLISAGCGGGGGTPVTTGTAGGNVLPGSGISGSTRAYPSTPTQTAGKTDPGIPVANATVSVRTCDQLSATAANTCSVVGGEVTRTTSDANGNFSVSVDPGQYVLVGVPPNNGSSLPRFLPDNTLVTVTSGQMTSAIVRFDSGIR